MEKLGHKNVERVVLVVLLIVVILASLRDYSNFANASFDQSDSRINNYFIFVNSFQELIHGGDLYELHPEEHYDYYKYSPAFAVLMAPFYALPVLPGLILWNLLNLLVPFLALKLLPKINRGELVLIMLVASLELIGSIMNEQSNGLMAGLMIGFLAMMERDRPISATFLLVLSVSIKLYSGILVVVLLCYPNLIRNILYGLGWTIIFAFLPLIITGWDFLIMLYESWLNLLQSDHDASYGYSVMGILHTWFGLELNKFVLAGSGLLVMLAPLLFLKRFNDFRFRYDYVAALMIWVIIFNHKAESPTYVIAMMGIGLWFVNRIKITRWEKVLLGFAICFVSLAFSDLVPPDIRKQVFYAYSIKALPCIVIWVRIISDLIRKVPENPALT